MKTHWLYGIGPNKELTFNVEIDEETNCALCCHKNVCALDMSKRCINYEFGTSEYKPSDCYSCIHHYTRYDKDRVPCFKCEDFQS